jgi:hypothetical protein
MQMIRYFAMLVALALPASALAHGGGEHIMGTVKAVDATSLTVETKDKKEVKVLFDDKTKFEKGGATASAKDVSVGARVVVHTAKKAGATEPTAVLVKLGAAEAHASHAPAGPKATTPPKR